MRSNPPPCSWQISTCWSSLHISTRRRIFHVGNFSLDFCLCRFVGQRHFRGSFDRYRVQNFITNNIWNGAKFGILGLELFRRVVHPAFLRSFRLRNAQLIQTSVEGPKIVALHRDHHLNCDLLDPVGYSNAASSLSMTQWRNFSISWLIPFSCQDFADNTALNNSLISSVRFFISTRWPSMKGAIFFVYSLPTTSSALCSVSGFSSSSSPSTC